MHALKTLHVLYSIPQVEVSQLFSWAFSFVVWLCLRTTYLEHTIQSHDVNLGNFAQCYCDAQQSYPDMPEMLSNPEF
jgi:hypothetical protein